MQKNKQIITTRTILLKSNYKKDLLKASLLIIFIILIALLYLIKNKFTFIEITFIDVITIMIVLFGFCKSIQYLYYGFKKYSLLKNENFDVFIDKIIDKRKVIKRDEYDIKQHQVHLGTYTCLTKKYYIIEDIEEFKNTRINSNCFLIFSKLQKEPLMLFSSDDYILDEKLEKNIISSLEKYNLRKE